MDKHIIEALGKAKVTIKDGKVVDVGEPIIEYCPLFHKHRGIEKLTKEEIQKNIQFRIDDFGMCKKNRQLRLKDFLSFGISEILSTLLDNHIIDAAVMVCEGCGTLIVCDGELAQGVGGRVSGLVETSTIPEIIEKFPENHILNSNKAIINQLAGAELAIQNGYKKIAITVANLKDAINLRKLEEEFDDVELYIFAVHTTGITREDAEILFEISDLITSCASKHLRDIAKEKEIFSVGTSIPIYACNKNGEYFINLRLDKINACKNKTGNFKSPYPLI